MHRSSKKSLRNAKARWEIFKETDPFKAMLMNTVCQNDVKQVKALLKDSPCFATCPVSPTGTTLLGLAVCRGHKEMVKYLLTYKGQNFNKFCDSERYSLLGLSIERCHPEIAKILLEEPDSGLDVNQSFGTKSPLRLAVTRNQVQIVKILLEKKEIIKSDIHSLLFVCCEANYIEMAALLLDHMENQYEMMDQKYRGFSLLGFAFSSGNICFMNLFINNGASVNTLFYEEHTYLTYAVSVRNVDMVSYLLSLNKIDINAKNAYGYSALMIAEVLHYDTIVNQLLKKGAKSNYVLPKVTREMLSEEAWHGMIQYSSVDALLALKDLNLWEGVCHSLAIPLLIQYYNHKTNKPYKRVIKDIYSKWTTSELSMDDMVLKLMTEEEDTFVEFLKFYIFQQEKFKADIELDAIKPNGKPLISYAVEHQCMKIFDTLYAYINNIDQKDVSGRTPLAYAAAGESFYMFNQLLKKHANFQEKDLQGCSILSYALEGLNNRPNHIGSQCMVQTLLNYDDLNVSVVELTDSEYMQLLDLVLQNKKKVQWIPKVNIFGRCINQIKHPAHILAILNKINKEKENDKPFLRQVDLAGRTLLSHFAQTGSLELVEELMKQYGTINIIDRTDNIGRTPLFYALENDDPSIVKILLQNQADINHVDKQTCTPLLYAIERKCNIKVINMLLEYKADLSWCDEQNHGALCYAIHHHHLSVVDTLLPQMIKDSKCDTELCMALYLAKSNNTLYTKLIEAITPLFEQDNSQWIDKKRSKKWGSRQLVSYSMHAKQRAKERGIELDTMKQVIQNPHVIQQSKQSNGVIKVLKLMDKNICVVVTTQQENIIVITTYKLGPVSF